MNEVRLLSPPTNYAVVHLPGRHFPGVVFQGDSLNGLIRDLEAAISESEASERALAFARIVEELHGVRSDYEAVLEKAGMPLPYQLAR